ncbi:2-succinyl-5-enolpyruvyl-6-hydroxy-3-cyclohexene-1-carboxylic-acid synthase [Aphanothece hegewaldii CCALA 016]|uniref:2-succinyl-5-enolpyruvyl-6-hydroxy-3-cyclohexene-1-carboxylate synthase n=1 Tax=Aphanothece hegewaldii CCALA 016 TaxID=2107694 RepID=A0A2T1LWP9_9CHRO|nr:2-succinyl-5-enolpyruvyl-6-hydroxy-3-cyclohexene-1-carboxylic-acid synthase [Aphanothece hegewaldii]PSF36576.1 2-succinyl-5-enolpyruvyl-6-hydroxy-3-cyclohexene-1-carboxylic-acid synthase [Aphanothece hegewaldii CCALA 016]
MTIDFRNINTLWGSVLVETLHRLGLKTAVICPGSRSTPIAIAFAQHPNIDAIPILDERSASFFALGLAKQQGIPVALVCTSGTAGANFYPAVIEAKESRVSLLVLTADRPPELRHCHAGQTIDQLRLYGHYPTWQAELATPEANLERLSYLRQTIIHAWRRSLDPIPGIVHLNIPLRDPLPPIPQPETIPIQLQWNQETFFSHIPPQQVTFPQIFSLIPYEQWQSLEKGIIIAGVDQSYFPQEYCQAIATLAQHLQYPVLAEALSPIRNYADLNPYLISTYDIILRNSEIAQKLTPDIVIQIGELPTSKELRTWLEKINPTRWIITTSADNLDALHGKTIHLRTTLEQLTETLPKTQNLTLSIYAKQWHELERKIQQKMNKMMIEENQLVEGKVAWLLPQILPAQTPIIIANSMPVRDVEFFWMPNSQRFYPYFSRGANGIDGTLSTALGISYKNNKSVLLTGDLALLHDTNGFLIKQKFIGSLTIIVINNNGGGIFEMLSISQFEPPFEDFFATPQNIDFKKLCHTYGVDYYLIHQWSELIDLLNPLPENGIRLIEVPIHRKNNAQWLNKTLNTLAENIDF